MNALPRLLVFVLFAPGCSLVLSDAPDGGPLADAGAAISTDGGTARPSADASVEPPADAGAARPYDAGPRSGCRPAVSSSGSMKTATCASRSAEQRLPRRSGAARDHRWLRDAQSVLYAAPQAAGDGSGSDAGNAGSLEAMVAAAGAEATAVLLAPGTYTLSDPLRAGGARSQSLVGPCAAQVIIELGAPMTTSGSVQLYGLAVRGPLSAEEGASNSAIIVSGSGTFKLLQSTVNASGHGVELHGRRQRRGVISGVTFGAVRDSALHATDAGLVDDRRQPVRGRSANMVNIGNRRRRCALTINEQPR